MNYLSKIFFILPNLNTGGAQKTTIRLANIFYRKGFNIEIIVLGNAGDLIKEINPKIKCTFFNKRKISQAFFKLCFYLRKHKPSSIFTCMNYLNVLTTIATKITIPSTKLIISERGVFSEEAKLSSKFYYYFLKFTAFITYRLSDEIIAVSKGVAEDLTKTLKLKRKKIKVIYNPTISENLIKQSNLAIKNKHLHLFNKPTILSIGRLEHVKGFDILIKAFSKVLKKMDATLIIIGGGSQKNNLINLTKKLKINQFTFFPGMISNPYPYLKKADIYVLSSRREGLPNVLIEAIGLGKTVIAQDCKYGPKEIIGDSKWGYLIKEDDEEKIISRMALKITEVLQNKKYINPLKRAQDFHEEKIFKDYLKLLN